MSRQMTATKHLVLGAALALVVAGGAVSAIAGGATAPYMAPVPPIDAKAPLSEADRAAVRAAAEAARTS